MKYMNGYIYHCGLLFAPFLLSCNTYYTISLLVLQVLFCLIYNYFFAVQIRAKACRSYALRQCNRRFLRVRRKSLLQYPDKELTSSHGYLQDYLYNTARPCS